LGATGDWECKPQNEDELEGVVERKPVHDGEQALKYSQEGEDNPVREPLSVVGFSRTEQSFQRVVPWKDKPSKIRKELTSDVEKYKKEVERNDTQESVDFRNVALLFEIVQGWVFGEFLINLGDSSLNFVLERHFGGCVLGKKFLMLLRNIGGQISKSPIVVICVGCEKIARW